MGWVERCWRSISNTKHRPPRCPRYVVMAYIVMASVPQICSYGLGAQIWNTIDTFCRHLVMDMWCRAPAISVPSIPKRLRTCMRTCMSSHMFTRRFRHMSIILCITGVHVHIHAHVHTQAHTHVRVHVHVHTHTCIYAHVHCTQAPISPPPYERPTAPVYSATARPSVSGLVLTALLLCGAMLYHKS